MIVAEHLRILIVEQNMEHGSRFPSEGELIEMFGVGRSTIREAVKLLVAENIVEIQRGRGTFITQQPGLTNDPLGLTFANQKDLLKNLLETRLIIEPEVAFLAANRATKQNIIRLEETLHRFSQTPDFKEQHALLDIEFHSAVAECTQNDVLHRVLPIICESIRTGYYETITVDGSQSRAMTSHTNIFKAIQLGHAEMAKEETKRHIHQTATDANVNLGGS